MMGVNRINLKNTPETGNYGKRHKEVAARTVLKHHKEKVHKKGE